MKFLPGVRILLFNLLTAGKQDGEIRSDTDVDALADVIIGTCGTICLTWRLGGYSFPLRARTLLAIKMVLEAFSPVAK